METAAIDIVLKRCKEQKIEEVEICAINLDDLLAVWEGGRGNDLGIKKPTIGDKIAVDDLERLVESAHNLAGEDQFGLKLPDLNLDFLDEL